MPSDIPNIPPAGMNDHALQRGLADICTYRLGRRPLIKTDASLYRLVLGRFERSEVLSLNAQ